MAQNPSPFSNLPNATLGSNPISSQPLAGGDARFRHARYTFRRKLLKLLGAAFYVDDPQGQVVLYADRKAFQLKREIRLFTGEDCTTEVLRITGRSVLTTTYEVFDAATNQKIGALRRHEWKSLARDQWTILDAQDRDMGNIEEDSLALALIRRFVEIASMLLPQKYTVTVGNRVVGTFLQNKNPFWLKISADFSSDSEQTLDRRLAIAAGILLMAIEGKQR